MSLPRPGDVVGSPTNETASRVVHLYGRGAGKSAPTVMLAADADKRDRAVAQLACGAFGEGAAIRAPRVRLVIGTAVACRVDLVSGEPHDLVRWRGAAGSTVSLEVREKCAGAMGGAARLRNIPA